MVKPTKKTKANPRGRKSYTLFGIKLLPRPDGTFSNGYDHGPPYVILGPSKGGAWFCVVWGHCSVITLDVRRETPAQALRVAKRKLTYAAMTLAAFKMGAMK